jgi:hypothetical protein
MRWPLGVRPNRAQGSADTASAMSSAVPSRSASSVYANPSRYSPVPARPARIVIRLISGMNQRGIGRFKTMPEASVASI